jgi:hypothetical protein
MEFRIMNFSEYITETSTYTPAQRIENALLKIKKTIELYFSNNDSDLKSPIEYEQGEKIKRGAATLRDMALELVTSEINKYSVLEDYYKVKFQDSQYMYMVTFSIKTIDTVDSNSTIEPETCMVLFKKYDLDGKFIDKIEAETDLKSIDEDFLIKMKIDLEDEAIETDELEVEYSDDENQNDNEIETEL